jgi:signal recognition particle subunit SRP54
MFEELSEKLDGVFGRFRQRGLLTETQIREGLREVRRVAAGGGRQLPAGPKDFLARVEERVRSARRC